jgi:hypothetical protein
MILETKRIPQQLASGDETICPLNGDALARTISVLPQHLQRDVECERLCPVVLSIRTSVRVVYRNNPLRRPHLQASRARGKRASRTEGEVNPAERRLRRLEDNAYHEAGHAVVAGLLGLAAAHATIVPNVEASSAGHLYAGSPDTIRDLSRLCPVSRYVAGGSTLFVRSGVTSSPKAESFRRL